MNKIIRTTSKMDLSILRRRSPDGNQLQAAAKEGDCVSNSLQRRHTSFLAAILLLSLLLIWCSSIVLSGSFFRVCVSSRKLNLHCISGGAWRKFGIVGALDHNDVNGTERVAEEVEIDRRKEEIVKAVGVVQEQVRVIRSWASRGSNVTTTAVDWRTCDGRGVFVYDLPAKFNKDLMEQCDDLLPWKNLCEYFANDAMGEPIHRMGRGWYKTHQYALEPIFHLRVSKHPCRVHNPDDAKLFYVPFYGGLDILRWHFKNNVSVEVKDALGVELVKWLENQKPWVRNRGKDHVFVLGKISWDFRRREDSWGSNFLDLDQMRNPYKFLIERQPWQINDIGIPHPTHFHPHSDDDIAAWQSRIVNSPRRHLVSFAGAARPGASENIRSVLIKQCTASSEHCEFLDCKSGGCSNPETVVEMFTESEFCLQPPGDSPTRKSVFDSLVSGCIPVLFDPFTAYYQYPWHLPEDHNKYSVFIDHEQVRERKVDVIERLRRVPVTRRGEMRWYIVSKLLPGLVYGDPSSEFKRFHDAFSVAMNNLMDWVTRSDS